MKKDIISNNEELVDKVFKILKKFKKSPKKIENIFTELFEKDFDVQLNEISQLEDGLLKDNFKRGVDYEIMLVPNIVNITYGRGVGYAFDEEVFDEATHSISATKIRKKMRDEGKLK